MTWHAEYSGSKLWLAREEPPTAFGDETLAIHSTTGLFWQGRIRTYVNLTYFTPKSGLSKKSHVNPQRNLFDEKFWKLLSDLGQDTTWARMNRIIQQFNFIETVLKDVS